MAIVGVGGEEEEKNPFHGDKTQSCPDVAYWPSTQLVEKKQMLRVSSGLSCVNSGERVCGSDSPVREELSTFTGKTSVSHLAADTLFILFNTFSNACPWMDNTVNLWCTLKIPQKLFDILQTAKWTLNDKLWTKCNETAWLCSGISKRSFKDATVVVWQHLQNAPCWKRPFESPRKLFETRPFASVLMVYAGRLVAGHKTQKWVPAACLNAQ